MSEEAPQWLRDAFTTQSHQIAELAAQQANSMATLASRLSDVEDRTIDSTEHLGVQNHTPARSDISSNLTNFIRRPKPSLPNPDKFDGKDLALYPQFEGILRAKLEIDGQSIGGEKEQVWYGFGRLSGDAAGRIYPWISYAQEVGKFTVEGLLDQMKVAFRDPRQRQKALGQLNRTKQGSQVLNDFLNDFNRLILEAEGWGWDEVIKKGYLKAAISTKLVTGMVGTKEEESYDDYCSQLRMISDQQAEVAELMARRNRWNVRSTTNAARPQAQADTMDWELTTSIAAARTREPRWATPDEIERRKQEGLCLRCGQTGHMVRDCRTKLPAQKKEVRAAATKSSKTKGIRAKKTQPVAIEEEEMTTDSNESGKE